MKTTRRAPWKRLGNQSGNKKINHDIYSQEQLTAALPNPNKKLHQFLWHL